MNLFSILQSSAFNCVASVVTSHSMSKLYLLKTMKDVVYLGSIKQMHEIMHKHLPACGKNCNPENLSPCMNINDYTVLKKYFSTDLLLCVNANVKIKKS